MSPKARARDPRLISLPSDVRAARLRLRRPASSMARALADAWAEGYSSLYPWFHAEMGSKTQEAEAGWQEARLARQIRDFEAQKSLSYYVLEGDTLIGMVGLLPIWRRGQFKLTYWIRPTAQRKGYGLEATGAMVVLSFQALDARLVTSGNAEPNIGSARLAQASAFGASEGLGFTD
ncbi:GNAT family N-acetyltransferase [Thioclava sp. BHET1]|nr:GNAT family N-acetyltransferase [Thioclava sp. BHET1]